MAILLTIFMLYDGALVQLKSFGVGQSGVPLSIDAAGGSDGGGGGDGSSGGTGTQCFNSVLTHQLSTHSNGSHHVMNVTSLNLLHRLHHNPQYCSLITSTTSTSSLAPCCVMQ